MSIPCSFCGRNSEFEVQVFRLQEIQPRLSKHVSGEGHRAGLFAKLFLCDKCLPFKKILEVTTEEKIKVKKIIDQKL